MSTAALLIVAALTLAELVVERWHDGIEWKRTWRWDGRRWWRRH